MKYEDIIIGYFVKKTPRSWAASSQIELSDGTGTKYQNIKQISDTNIIKLVDTLLAI